MSDWKKAATHPLPDGSDPDDAMEEIEEATTELPLPMKDKGPAGRTR